MGNVRGEHVAVDVASAPLLHPTTPPVVPPIEAGHAFPPAIPELTPLEITALSSPPVSCLVSLRQLAFLSSLSSRVFGTAVPSNPCESACGMGLTVSLPWSALRCRMV